MTSFLLEEGRSFCVCAGTYSRLPLRYVGRGDVVVVVVVVKKEEEERGVLS